MDAQKWVWFDLDDTLHDFTYTLNAAVSDALNLIVSRTSLPMDSVRENYLAVLREHNKVKFSDGKNSKQYRWERFNEAMSGCQIEDEDKAQILNDVLSAYDARYMETLQLKPGAIPLLQKIRQAGLNTAILTDGATDVQQRVLEQLGLLKYFDEVFTSGALRLSKSMGMMDLVLEKTRLVPSQVTMIGDSLESDIIPAIKTGITAIWFNDQDRKSEVACKQANSLDEVWGLLSTH